MGKGGARFSAQYSSSHKAAGTRRSVETECPKRQNQQLHSKEISVYSN